MSPYDALYSKRCRSPIGWFEVGKPSCLGPDLIFKTLYKVHITRNHLQMAYSRQKSYADHRRRDLEFEESDKVFDNFAYEGCGYILQERKVESSLCGSL